MKELREVAFLAVMLIVAAQLGIEILIDWRSWIIALLSITALFTIKKTNAAYIVPGGAIVGWLLSLV